MKGLLAIVAVALLLGQHAAGASTRCPGVLVPETEPWVRERLAEADALLGARDVDAAALVLYRIREFPRSADVSVSPRCLGDELSLALFKAEQRLALLYAERDERNGQARGAILHYAKAGAVDKARALTAALPVDVLARQGLVGEFKAMSQWTPSMSAGGDILPLPAEKTLMQEYARLADEISWRLIEGARKTLAEEAAAMDAPISAEERVMIDTQRRGEAMIAALAERGETENLQFPVSVVRGSTSLQMVREAVNMFQAAGADLEPAQARARSRGEQMLAVAADEGVMPEARARVNRFAVDFFRLAGDESRQRQAEARQARLDALAEAAQARRSELAEAAAAEMQQTAEEVKKAAAEMEKTDAEKQAFKDEADALEKELGF